jgi:hypothetical protein
MTGRVPRCYRQRSSNLEGRGPRTLTRRGKVEQGSYKWTRAAACIRFRFYGNLNREHFACSTDVKHQGRLEL